MTAWYIDKPNLYMYGGGGNLLLRAHNNIKPFFWVLNPENIILSWSFNVYVYGGMNVLLYGQLYFMVSLNFFFSPSCISSVSYKHLFNPLFPSPSKLCALQQIFLLLSSRVEVFNHDNISSYDKSLSCFLYFFQSYILSPPFPSPMLLWKDFRTRDEAWSCCNASDFSLWSNSFSLGFLLFLAIFPLVSNVFFS